MSGENVKKVIARAVSDAGFRELLFRNPDGALGDYDLTEQEKAGILAGLSREGFDTLASDLGDRTSRAGIHLGDIAGELAEEINPGPVFSERGSQDDVAQVDAVDEASNLPTPIPGPEEDIDPTPIWREGGGQDDVAQVDAVDEASNLPIPLPLPGDEPEPADDLASSLPLPMPGPGDELEPVDDLASDLPIPLPDPADEPGGGGLEEVGKIDSFTLEADELGAAPAGPEVGDVSAADVIDFQDGEDLMP